MTPTFQTYNPAITGDDAAQLSSIMNQRGGGSMGGNSGGYGGAAGSPSWLAPILNSLSGGQQQPSTSVPGAPRALPGGATPYVTANGYNHQATPTQPAPFYSSDDHNNVFQNGKLIRSNPNRTSQQQRMTTQDAGFQKALNMANAKPGTGGMYMPGYGPAGYGGAGAAGSAYSGMAGGGYGGGAAGGAGNVGAQLQAAQDKANAANNQRYAQLLGLSGQLSDSQLTREKQFTQNQLGGANQMLQSRGLGNSTIVAGVDKGINDQSGIRQQEIGDQGMRTAMGIIERKTDLGPDYGLIASLASRPGAVGGFSGGGFGGGGGSAYGGAAGGASGNFQSPFSRGTAAFNNSVSSANAGGNYSGGGYGGGAGSGQGPFSPSAQQNVSQWDSGGMMPPATNSMVEDWTNQNFGGGMAGNDPGGEMSVGMGQPGNGGLPDAYATDYRKLLGYL